MKKAQEIIARDLKEALLKAFPGEPNGFLPAIDNATNASFGDFQCNIAMLLSKQLKQAPRSIAEQVLRELAESAVYEKPSIAGPGFINIKLKAEFLETAINEIKKDPRLGIKAAAPAKKVLVDMSSPNIAKEMHVGHLRSTIIGDSIARTFQFLGHDVLKINHVGDWGTQFGMLIAELKEKYPAALSQADALDLGDLVDFYKASKKHFDEDPEFKARAHKEVVSLQSGSPESVKAWKLLCQQSRKAFEQIYEMLDIQDLHERGESYYNDLLKPVVEDLEKCGLAVEDQGAKCVFLEGYKNEEGKPLPLIVQKSDGGFNYAATDLAAIRQRVEEDKADEIIYVVGAEQALHLSMIMTAAAKAGWLPEHVRAEHVGFGAVLGEDGKKLKTRSGETVKLKDLLEEAIENARGDLDKRLEEKGRQEPDDWKAQISRMIGIAAVKYADLSLNRMTNYHFSFKKMLSLQGNTAPYMMYAYVRVRGISREGAVDFEQIAGSEPIRLKQSQEIELAKQLLRFELALDAVRQEFLPNRICDYLFELSQKFNQFYENCPVLNAEPEIRTSRLLLCDLTARTIKAGMSLLGISLPERM